MMYEINTNYPGLKNDFEDILRLFFNDVTGKTGFFVNAFVNVFINGCEVKAEAEAELNGKKYVKTSQFFSSGTSGLLDARTIKRNTKNLLYDVLVDSTGIEQAWGSLTGIRPTKLCYEYLANGGTIDGISGYLQSEFRVSSIKARLAQEIVKNQKGIYNENNDSLALYINIPLCTSRCTYCSFASAVLSKCKSVDKYIDCLINEIELSKPYLYKYNLRSIYVGGGTPTAIPPKSLSRILAVLPKSSTGEITVEAGRADTITQQHLDVLKQHNATRISINPQTFKDETLAKIGRSHTAEDVFRAYSLAKTYNFDINMDLIAGLPDENLKDFEQTIDTVIALEPHNITVHTLCFKRGSSIQAENQNISNLNIADMLGYSRKKLKAAKYLPYYMYRQKNMLGNFENTGYTLKGHQCINNIDTMEETASVLACGAGAISKRIYSGGRIERSANVKFIDDYIERFNEMLLKKQTFWE